MRVELPFQLGAVPFEWLLIGLPALGMLTLFLLVFGGNAAEKQTRRRIDSIKRSNRQVLTQQHMVSIRRDDGDSGNALLDGLVHTLVPRPEMLRLRLASAGLRLSLGKYLMICLGVGLFFFGLLNAGVEFSSIGSPTWLVLLGLIVGKPVGVLLFGWIAAGPLGLGLPKGMRTIDLFVIGCVARVDAMKDFPTLCAALDRLEGVTCLAIGKDTGTLPPTRGLVALGERNDVPALLDAMGLLVSVSAFGEGFSNAIGEAMASGVPVLATDVGDARRIIGIGGRIVPGRNPAALAEAIAALRDDPQTRRAMGKAGRQRIERDFSLRRSAEAFDALYREALIPGIASDR